MNDERGTLRTPHPHPTPTTGPAHPVWTRPVPFGPPDRKGPAV
ncbi:hypothetical protein [Streptomyces sp. NPDC051546]